MAKVIEMPKLSDTMEEGGIANWLKKEGDFVNEGDVLVEIETDKATQEYESPEEGTLLKIIVHPGKTVALRTPIAVIGEQGEAIDLDALVGAKGANNQKAAATSASTSQSPQPAKASPTTGATSQMQKASALPTSESSTALSSHQDNGRLRSSPLARKMAKEHGLDLNSLGGSGPGGRIVMRDVEGAISPKGVGSASTSEVGAGGQRAAESGATLGGGDSLQPVSMMRKTIAKRLLAAKNDAPHFYLTVSADMAKALTWRQRLNDDAVKSEGKLPKVSVNDLVILAVARALRQHPVVNSSWQGDAILQHAAVHVALAVALPEGLVTPVIRETDRLGVRGIASRAKDLALKAKEGKLGNADYAGGTFTISNLGMYGIEEFTAIINPPQAAILAVGATQAVPAVNSQGEIVVQQRMKMTMSCDHRVVDGATGAQFLQTLVRYLEDPMEMMA